MHRRFRELLSELHSCQMRLVRMKPVTFGTFDRDRVPERGVYLFSERGKSLYVGRSNNICARLGRHCKPNATWRQAAFAFQLARQVTGNFKATYRKEGSRQALAADPTFMRAFVAAKDRIRNMQVRYVGEPDPTRQALLEMYVAVVLKTPYNDFNNH